MKIIRQVNSSAFKYFPLRISRFNFNTVCQPNQGTVNDNFRNGKFHPSISAASNLANRMPNFDFITNLFQIDFLKTKLLDQNLRPCNFYNESFRIRH